MGRPALVLRGEARQVSLVLGLSQWDVSLTHTHTTATAVVVAL
jgi:phosphopantetheinyl transferase (holo-ACP synthase)